MIIVQKQGMTNAQATTEYLNAIKAGNQTYVKLVFNNYPDPDIEITVDDIELSGGITLTTIRNADIDLKYGNVFSHEVVAYIFENTKTANINWQNQMRLYFGVKIGNDISWVEVNRFYGDKPSKTYSNGVSVLQYIAHDKTYTAFNTIADDFISSLTFPMSFNDFLNQIAGYLNINIGTPASLNLSPYTLNKNTFQKGITFRSILSWIGECINADGSMARRSQNVFNFDFYYQTFVQYEIDEDDYFSINESEDLTPVFPAIKVSDSMDSTINSVYPSTYSDVPYNIYNNPIMNALSSSDRLNLITALYNNTQSNFSYLPVTIDAIGNWLIEIGDVIRVKTQRHSYQDVPIFARTLTWNGSCFDNYECTGNPIRDELSESETEEIYNDGRYVGKETVGDAAECDVANDLTTTDPGYVLDARQGKALKDQLGSLQVVETILVSNSTTFTLEPYTSYILFGVSGNSTHQGLWVIMGFDTGSQVRTIQAGSAVTVSASGSVITVSHSTSRNTRYTLIKCGVFTS